jgi:hypothetical protein
VLSRCGVFLNIKKEMVKMKTQLYSYLVQTLNGKLQWRFNDSLGQYQGIDRMGSLCSLKLGHSSAEDVFLVIRGNNQEIIYDCDTATVQDEEEREILQALMKAVTMLYRDPRNDKDAVFY